MRLKLAGVEIPRRYLTNVILSIGSVPVSFAGVLRDDREGEFLRKKLLVLSKRKVIDYEAEDARGVPLTGLCNIVNLRVEKDTSYKIYRFSGQLQVVV